MLARKEEACLAGTAVAAVLAKIAWSCADVERNFVKWPRASHAREIKCREREDGGRQQCRQSSVVRVLDGWKSGALNDFLGGTGRSATSSMVSTERPLLELVTVVSRAVLILWNVVACPPRASERVQGRSEGGDYRAEKNN